MADLYPHTCIGYIRDSNIPNLSQIKVIMYNDYQVLCHPRFQAYNRMPITANIWTVQCNQPNTFTYFYNSQGDIVYTCEYAPQIRNCIFAQKFQNIMKCQYCNGNYTDSDCSSLGDVGYSLFLQSCPPNCKRCDILLTHCFECSPGYSPLNQNDKLCNLKCHPEHYSCSIDSVTGIYKFQYKCQYGYELIKQSCQRICKQCFKYYKMMNDICIGDANCIIVIGKKNPFLIEIQFSSIFMVLK